MDKGLIFAPKFGKAVLFKQPQLSNTGGGQAADPACSSFNCLFGGLGAGRWFGKQTLEHW